MEILWNLKMKTCYKISWFHLENNIQKSLILWRNLKMKLWEFKNRLRITRLFSEKISNHGTKFNRNPLQQDRTHFKWLLTRRWKMIWKGFWKQEIRFIRIKINCLLSMDAAKLLQVLVSNQVSIPYIFLKSLQKLYGLAPTAFQTIMYPDISSPPTYLAPNTAYIPNQNNTLPFLRIPKTPLGESPWFP